MKNFSPIAWHTDHVIQALEISETPRVFPRVFSGISTDSRIITDEDLFVALQGDTFDGHQFIFPLLERGIKGFVMKTAFFNALSPAEKERFSGQNACVFCVDNPLNALGRLGAFQRRRASAKIIAITGSCGKTSTREMIASILRQKYTVLSTPGNLNNEIGLPLTLLKLSTTHQWAVVEMGMNHEGELTRLGNMATPDMGIITNTFKAHLEGLGSVDAVARAKSELLPCIKEKGLAILNRNDHRCHIMEKVARTRPISCCFFGTHGDADVSGHNISSDGEGLSFTLKTSTGDAPINTKITLQTPAPVMVENALAAAAAALGAGMDTNDIRRGLGAFRPVKGRMEILESQCLDNGGKIKIINDTYNANPGSMAAALNILKVQSSQSPTVAVLGDMLELGDQAPMLHREMGELAATVGLSHLFLHGNMADHVLEGALSKGFPRKRILTGSHGALVDGLKKIITPGMWILVKGSRGMHMEHIVTALQQRLGEKD